MKKAATAEGRLSPHRQSQSHPPSWRHEHTIDQIVYVIHTYYPELEKILEGYRKNLSKKEHNLDCCHVTGKMAYKPVTKTWECRGHNHNHSVTFTVKKLSVLLPAYKRHHLRKFLSHFFLFEGYARMAFG